MNKTSSSAKDPHAFPVGPRAAATVLQDGAELRVVAGGATMMRLRLDEQLDHLKMLDAPDDPRLAVRAVSAAAEAMFGWRPGLNRIFLDSVREPIARELLDDGLAVVAGSNLVLLPDLVMQRRDNWLVDAERSPMPQLHVMTDGKRHPRRPQKPVGMVYARFIPWLSEIISFRVADLNDDLHLLHRWMNDPRVDAFWDEAGDLEKHRKYLSTILADPHMLPLIGCFGDAPFGYFEVYWAKENRIAPFYDADDYDRGWHVVVGEDAYRGRRYISAWLPSLMHYMFLDDCRTQRIVGEPAAAHSQQLRNLELSGFARIKNFDFPHKRATLVMLLRERFFGDRLWLPATAGPAPTA
ncbi:GNAT family N-acetyltransferase [Bradyrhizobium sp. AUGA SZCCT0182]|uniref:GNAT family N-acetyltransferase n=1 Tax=Bradyrhizobium sp. AUGA SZCCT0182 TaxID=2807667 RepID=UPI001BA5348A|nr:GNAT family N-acetyltransferase [Bradyrhizobium sp. AUGA SZCCT0182]MBR1237073.1 acetyltransferase [Bradyrhizobium sp. AUGA SZCCT0182]